MEVEPLWISKIPPKWRAFVVKLGFNLHPAFHGHGGKVIFVSQDLSHIRIRLPLYWRTRNMMGSLFGGALFSVTDGIHMAILSFLLGQKFVVWDKSAKIRFLKPCYDTIFADFVISPEDLKEIREKVAEDGEVTKDYIVNLKDKDDIIHAEVERTLYIADKEFFAAKAKAKKAKKKL